MDFYFLYQGKMFVWNREKGAANFVKHGIHFETACQVFLDPLMEMEDATSISIVASESREAAVGHSKDGKVLYVVHLTRDSRVIRIISARKAHRRKGEYMKTMSERIQLRMRKDRPMTMVSIRLPEDVIDDLKEIAPALGFSGYQPLIRAYIGQGLRKDLELLENSPAKLLTESLRRHGVDDEVISAAIADAQLKSA